MYVLERRKLTQAQTQCQVNCAPVLHTISAHRRIQLMDSEYFSQNEMKPNCCWVCFFLCSWKPRLSPLLALCIFLVCERHRGEASDWFPYINVLPTVYTCPAYFSDDVMALLPASVRRRALEQREAVKEMHSSNQEFFR